MRHRLTSAIVIAAAALGGLAVPGVAHAGTPSCLQGMFATREGGVLVQGVGDMETPVVHVRDKKTGQRVATVEKFRLEPHENALEWDRISEPLKLANLGIYTLEVGAEAAPVVCGDFDYRLRSEMTGPTAARVSLDNLKTTVSADLTGFDPRTQTSSPLANAKVSLAGEGVSQEVTTDAKGHLAAPYAYRGTERSTDVNIALAATPQMDAAESRLTVGTVRQKAKILLDPASQNIRATTGDLVTVTGQAVRVAADGTQTPVPQGTPLTRDLRGVPVTNAEGRFERQVRVMYGSFNTGWVNEQSYPWLEFVRVGTKVDFFHTSHFTNTKATIDSAKRVTFTGIFGRRPAFDKRARIEVQYSSDGKTGWKARNVTGVDAEEPYSLTVPGEADGYWRLVYTGDTTSDVVGSATAPVRLTRSETAFKVFDAAPEPVRKGQTFSIKGTLQHENPAWQAYAGQAVYIYFRPAGSQDFLYQGQAKTAADGTFVRLFKADRTGTWIARYRDADGKHFNAESRQDDLQVNP